jgi:hypothetical protein
MPQDSSERKLVPMPKQMTSALAGGSARNAAGRWAIIFVTGESAVMPTPFTSRPRFLPSCTATTVAV